MRKYEPDTGNERMESRWQKLGGDLPAGAHDENPTKLCITRACAYMEHGGLTHTIFTSLCVTVGPAKVVVNLYGVVEVGAGMTLVIVLGARDGKGSVMIVVNLTIVVNVFIVGGGSM